MEINDKTTIYPIGAPSARSAFEASERIEKKETLDDQKTESSGASDEHVVVSISRASREAQLIKEALESEDGVRHDRVSEIGRAHV